MKPGELRPFDFAIREGGSAEAVLNSTDAQLLVEGPAGTGKSRCDCEKAHLCCEMFEGCRVLLCRKSRKDMTDTILVTLERDVLPPTHPCRRGPSRVTRHSYRYPNGSEIVIGGLDTPEKTYWAEYDLIVVHEATQATKDDWQKLKRCLRSHKMPYQQMIAECNPDSVTHWLNQAAINGEFRRIKFTFDENPVIRESYIKTLASITIPHVRARLYEGRWVAAEGIIYNTFVPETHVLNGQLVKDEPTKRWKILMESWDKEVPLTWFVAGVDFGYAKAGVLGVWGIDLDRNVYLVHEVYQTHRDPVWWTEKLAELHEKYGFWRVVCDPSRPDNIKMFNKRLVDAKHPRIIRGQEIVTGGNNEWWPGVSIVRERFSQKTLYILGNCLEDMDQGLKEQGFPTRLTEEIPAYIYARKPDGSLGKEVADPACQEHSCDQMRYVMVFLDSHDWAPVEKERGYDEESYGYVLGHEDVDVTGKPWNWVELK